MEEAAELLFRHNAALFIEMFTTELHRSLRSSNPDTSSAVCVGGPALFLSYASLVDVVLCCHVSFVFFSLSCPLVSIFSLSFSSFLHLFLYFH